MHQFRFARGMIFGQREFKAIVRKVFGIALSENIAGLA